MIRLQTELSTAIELAGQVQARETLKRDSMIHSASVWESRIALVDLKRKFPTLGAKEDEELFHDKERVPKKTKTEAGFVPSYMFDSFLLICPFSQTNSYPVAYSRPSGTWSTHKSRASRTSARAYRTNQGAGRAGACEAEGTGSELGQCHRRKSRRCLCLGPSLNISYRIHIKHHRFRTRRACSSTSLPRERHRKRRPIPTNHHPFASTVHIVCGWAVAVACLSTVAFLDR